MMVYSHFLLSHIYVIHRNGSKKLMRILCGQFLIKFGIFSKSNLGIFWSYLRIFLKNSNVGDNCHKRMKHKPLYWFWWNFAHVYSLKNQTKCIGYHLSKNTSSWVRQKRPWGCRKILNFSKWAFTDFVQYLVKCED